MPDDIGLSRRAKYALIILEHARTPGVLTTGRTALIDNQPWIHWRTAYALQDRELVTIVGYGEEAEIHMGTSAFPRERLHSEEDS